MTSETASVPGWRRIASILGAVFLGAIFLIATWAKAIDPGAFASQIEAEGLDFLLPSKAVALIALVLEAALGTALLLAVRRRWVLWPTTILVTFFLFLTGRGYWRYLRGIEPPEGSSCGCFGNLVQRTPAEAFWQDFLLMVPALLLAWLAVETSRAWPRWRLAATGLATVAVLILAIKAPDLPLDDLATRLKPGSLPAEMCAGSPDDGSETCLDGILPELKSGEHLVILADVTAADFTSRVEELNEFNWTEGAPSMWVVTSANEEQMFEFRFGHGPTFEVREAPAALMKPLYRTLPRSFRVSEGVVQETYSGLPPLKIETPAATNR